MGRRGGKHNAYEGGVRSTAWLSGGPLDAAVVAAGGVAPSKRPDQAYYFGLMHAVDWMPTLSAGERRPLSHSCWVAFSHRWLLFSGGL